MFPTLCCTIARTYLLIAICCLSVASNPLKWAQAQTATAAATSKPLENPVLLDIKQEAVKTVDSKTNGKVAAVLCVNSRQLLPFLETENTLGLMPTEIEDIIQNQALVYRAAKDSYFDDGTIVLFPFTETTPSAQPSIEQTSFKLKNTRPGKYSIWLNCHGGKKHATITIKIDSKVIGSVQSHEISDAQGVMPQKITDFYFEEPGDRLIQLSSQNPIADVASSLILVPTSEGIARLQPEADGNITLHSKNSTVCGTLLRYETNPIKITLGYWAKESDTAFWEFQLNESSQFDIEIFQGCGKDNGGSQASVEIIRLDANQPPQQFRFTVEDTGHWQNFVPRIIGRANMEPGVYRLRLVPHKKAKVAVMDVRQIVLKKQD